MVSVEMQKLLQALQVLMYRYLEALGLLADLHSVLLSQLVLAPLVVLHLVGEFCLVLCSDQFGPGSLHYAELSELQLLGGLVVPQQHGALQVLLRLLLVQLLTETHEIISNKCCRCRKYE